MRLRSRVFFPSVFLERPDNNLIKLFRPRSKRGGGKGETKKIPQLRSN